MAMKSVNDVVPGEMLGEDVATARGVALMKAGVIVTDELLRTLKMWGVESVWVIQPGDREEALQEASEEWEKLLDEAEANLKQRFGGSLENEIMAEIFRVGVTLRAARLAAAKEK